MAIVFYLEMILFCIQEFHEIHRRQIACGVIQEHVFRAGIRTIDASISGARVPIVDGRVELKARVCATPRRISNLIPKFFRTDGVGDLTIGASNQVPIRIFLNGFHEFI